MDQNTCTIVGRLVAHPNAKQYTRKSGPNAGKIGVRTFFRVAVTRKADRGKAIGDASRRTNMIPVVVWGIPAERCAEFLRKGTEVAVTGEFICESERILDANGQPVLVDGRPQYKEYYHLQAEDVQFGRRSPKHSTVEQLQAEMNRIQAALNAAAQGEGQSTPASAPAAETTDGENPFEAPASA